MTKHFFGRVENKFRQRFLKEFTDAAFYQLMNELEGELPKGIFAWHLAETETIQNSKRVQAMAKLPIAVGAIGNILDPSTELLRMKAEQQLIESYKLRQQDPESINRLERLNDKFL